MARFFERLFSYLSHRFWQYALFETGCLIHQVVNWIPVSGLGCQGHLLARMILYRIDCRWQELQTCLGPGSPNCSRKAFAARVAPRFSNCSSHSNKLRFLYQNKWNHTGLWEASPHYFQEMLRSIQDFRGLTDFLYRFESPCIWFESGLKVGWSLSSKQGLGCRGWNCLRSSQIECWCYFVQAPLSDFNLIHSPFC